MNAREKCTLKLNTIFNCQDSFPLLEDVAEGDEEEEEDDDDDDMEDFRSKVMRKYKHIHNTGIEQKGTTTLVILFSFLLKKRGKTKRRMS